MIVVADYIPQAEPIIMISNLVTSTTITTTTQFLVKNNNVLVENGFLSEAGLVENIAQTAAFHAGYHRNPEEAVLIGFIGGIKKLKIHALPKAGETINTTIEIIHEVLGATIITGKTMFNSTILAECEMKIFLQEPENN